MGNRNNKQYNDWNINILEDTKITNSAINPTIYLLGDSHSGHYGEAMIDLASKKKFNFIMHPNGNGLKLLNNKHAEYILAPLREYKNNFKKGDVIIFSAHIDKYEKEQNYTKQYETFIQQTQKIGMKFILISPTPTFSKEMKFGYTCQEEWYRPSWTISPLCFEKIKKKEWFASNNMPISKIEKFLFANPKVSYIDAFSIVCPDQYCKNYDQNSFIYRDTNHLTSFGAMQISNTIDTLFRSQ